MDYWACSPGNVTANHIDYSGIQQCIVVIACICVLNVIGSHDPITDYKWYVNLLLIHTDLIIIVTGLI